MASSPTMEKKVPESRVLVIATGGTIMMTPSSEGLVPAGGFMAAGLEPRPSFNDGGAPGLLEVVMDDEGTRQSLRSLRTPASRHGRRTRYCCLEFEQLLDSSAVDSADWTRIAETVFRNYRLFDGFVVLHGTDTMAYTASALSFMLQDLGKPVILTGSQAAMSALQNDATDNLLGSLIIAGHFQIPEVCLYFNYSLFRGNRSTKVSASEYAAFGSPNHAPLATISSAGVRVLWRLVHRPRHVRALSLRTSITTAHVACLRIFPGIQASMISAVLGAPDLRGLVLETFGAGNVPSGRDNALLKTLAQGTARGLVIVSVSQCLSGSVASLYAPANALARAGVVLGYDMTTEAALTKLAYLLGREELSRGEVARFMSVSLRSELTEASGTHFQHPEDEDEDMKRGVEDLTAVGYAIAKGDGDTVLKRVEGGLSLAKTDYMGNTAVHMAAVGPNVEILAYLVGQGASVHARNVAGHTPLYLALEQQHEQHAQVLKAAGAHLHADEYGSWLSEPNTGTR